MHAFRITKPDAKGVTPLAKAQHIQRTTGKATWPLDGPEMPEAVLHVWAWFRELQEGRVGAGFGPSPFSWSDLKAFFELSEIEPRPWEVRMIRVFDRAYLDANATEEKKDE